MCIRDRASLPADAAAPLHALRPDATDASWALRWVGSHKNVHVILSGMSAEDQLTDNLATFGHFEPLSPAENAAVESVAKELHRRIKIGCTEMCIRDSPTAAQTGSGGSLRVFVRVSLSARLPPTRTL